MGKNEQRKIIEELKKEFLMGLDVVFVDDVEMEGRFWGGVHKR